jgi:hypothetical protein
MSKNLKFVGKQKVINSQSSTTAPVIVASQRKSILRTVFASCAKYAQRRAIVAGNASGVDFEVAAPRSGRERVMHSLIFRRPRQQKAKLTP